MTEEGQNSRKRELEKTIFYYKKTSIFLTCDLISANKIPQ